MWTMSQTACKNPSVLEASSFAREDCLEWPRRQTIPRSPRIMSERLPSLNVKYVCQVAYKKVDILEYNRVLGLASTVHRAKLLHAVLHHVVDAICVNVQFLHNNSYSLIVHFWLKTIWVRPGGTASGDWSAAGRHRLRHPGSLQTKSIHDDSAVAARTWSLIQMQSAIKFRFRLSFTQSTLH